MDLDDLTTLAHNLGLMDEGAASPGTACQIVGGRGRPFIQTTTDALVAAGWEDAEAWWQGHDLPVRIRRSHVAGHLDVDVEDVRPGHEGQPGYGLWHPAYPGAEIPAPDAE